MGIFDKVKRAVQGRSNQINKAVDSATSQINKRTNNKYADKLAKGSSKVKKTVDDLDRRSGPSAPHETHTDTATDTHASTDTHVDTATPRPADPAPPHSSRPAERD